MRQKLPGAADPALAADTWHLFEESRVHDLKRTRRRASWRDRRVRSELLRGFTWVKIYTFQSYRTSGSVRQVRLDPKTVPIPGSSFGRKKVPDLNPAKLSAGFRKKRRRHEKTSGYKILKNRDDNRSDHTSGNCLCAASSPSGAHSNLPVPIALAHLPNGLRAEPSQNISNLCPSKDFQEETKEHVAMNSSFSATVSLKCFFTKWVALHDSYAS